MNLPGPQRRRPIRPARAALLLGSAALLGHVAVAWAAGGGDEGAADGGAIAMGQVVLLLAFVGVAYLLAHFVIDRIQKRFLFSSGLEFIVLGVLLGPAVPEIEAFDQVNPIAPVIALAAGWVGLVYGMDLDLGKVVQARDHALRIGIADAVGNGVPVAIVAHWAFGTGWFGEIPGDQAWLAAGLMGCTAAAGSGSALQLIQRTFGESPVQEFLQRAARLGDVVVIFAFGTLFCLFHAGATATVEPPNPSDWFLVTVGIGVGLGALFSLFLGQHDTDNERFVALVGIITFAAGAAFFLNISVLLVNLVLGLVLANTHPAGADIRKTLKATNRPISLVLLVFAGALWRPVDPVPAIAVIVGLVAVRFLAVTAAMWVASLGTPLRRDLSLGLLAQGDVAVAMALSFRLAYEGHAVDLAYTAVLGSVVISEIVAPRFLRRLLIDAGEIRQPASAASGG